MGTHRSQLIIFRSIQHSEAFRCLLRPAFRCLKTSSRFSRPASLSLMAMRRPCLPLLLKPSITTARTIRQVRKGREILPKVHTNSCGSLRHPLLVPLVHPTSWWLRRGAFARRHLCSRQRRRRRCRRQIPGKQFERPKQCTPSDFLDQVVCSG